jgi:hypothetical protein
MVSNEEEVHELGIRGPTGVPGATADNRALPDVEPNEGVGAGHGPSQQQEENQAFYNASEDTCTVDADDTEVDHDNSLSSCKEILHPHAFIKISLSGSGSTCNPEAVETVDRRSDDAVSPLESSLQLSPCTSFTGPNNNMQMVPKAVNQEEEAINGNIAVEEVNLPRVDGMSNEETLAFAKIKSFCANILKTLAPPLLKEIEGAKKLNAAADPFTPRRITRQQASLPTGAPTTRGKKASKAKTVLLKALGIVPEDLSVNEEDLIIFQRIFDSPLRDQHMRVIASIFGKVVPPSFENLGSGRVVVAA